jgi:protein SFI1
MLPATTFSTISGASTSLSGDVEFEIVEQIIERAPRSATCWPQVYRAYGEVLEEK